MGHLWGRFFRPCSYPIYGYSVTVSHSRTKSRQPYSRNIFNSSLLWYFCGPPCKSALFRCVNVSAKATSCVTLLWMIMKESVTFGANNSNAKQKKSCILLACGKWLHEPNLNMYSTVASSEKTHRPIDRWCKSRVMYGKVTLLGDAVSTLSR